MSFVSAIRTSTTGIVLCLSCISLGCSVAEMKSRSSADAAPASASQSATTGKAADPQGASIQIEANGPADTVRAFYKHLREGKFREAIFLTNLRPAIEGLTETELKDFSLDFEALAGQVPENIKINGEIVTGDKATVTADLPNEDGDKNELQSIKLRRENGVWVILTADDEAEKQISKEGKNYFYTLRIQTHEEEARKMLERISKAELAYSLQNGGVYGDVPTLISVGFLPDDIQSSASTGYSYSVELTADKKHFSAAALPAVYGKSGRLSFKLSQDEKDVSHVTSGDHGGKPLK